MLYSGYEEDGQVKKMSLEDAAVVVGISKKTLDDYLMQIRSAKKFGFDFARHYSEKVGVIRSFVKKKKGEEKKHKQALKESGSDSVAQTGSQPAARDKPTPTTIAVGKPPRRQVGCDAVVKDTMPL